MKNRPFSLSSFSSSPKAAKLSRMPWIVAVVIVLLLPHLDASADMVGEPGLAVRNAPGLGAGSTRTSGWQFTANQDFLITALGLVDINGFGTGAGINDGFAHAHSVIVWDTSGNQLASATVQSGTASQIGPGVFNTASGSTSGAFRYEMLTAPLSVTSGTSYVITAHYPGNVASSDARSNASSGSAAYSSLISYNGMRFIDGPTHIFPTQLFGGFLPIAGPNFLAVPEPNCFALIGLGLSIITMRHRRRKS